MENQTLSELMAINGYPSNYAFAKALGEDVNNVRKIIVGEKKPSIPKMLRYAKALKITPEEALWIFYPEEMQEFVKL